MLADLCGQCCLGFRCRLSLLCLLLFPEIVGAKCADRGGDNTESYDELEERLPRHTHRVLHRLRARAFNIDEKVAGRPLDTNR